MNTIEFSDDDLNQLIEKTRLLLQNRPPGADIVIIHSSPDDIDSLMEVIKHLKDEFLEEGVIPIASVLPGPETESEMLTRITVAFCMACKLLSTPAKNAEQWREDLIHRAIQASDSTAQEILEKAGLN